MQPSMFDSSAGSNSLDVISMTQFLDVDNRPSFVLDLETERLSEDAALRPVFMNSDLRSFLGVQQAICGENSSQNFKWPYDQSYDKFKTWARGNKDFNGEGYPSMPYTGLMWDLFSINHRWNIVTARIGVRSHSATATETLENHFYTAETIIGPQQSEADVQASGAGGDHQITSSQQQHRTEPSKSGFPLPTIEPSNPQYQHLISELKSQHEQLRTQAALIDMIAKMDAVALYIVDAAGEIIFCNDAWYDMSLILGLCQYEHYPNMYAEYPMFRYKLTSYPRGVTSALAWIKVWSDADQPNLYGVWQTLQTTKGEVKYQGQFHAKWKPPFHTEGEPEESNIWIQSHTFPTFDENGQMSGACGCLYDISGMYLTQRSVLLHSSFSPRSFGLYSVFTRPLYL